jgi:hypothetical protein
MGNIVNRDYLMDALQDDLEGVYVWIMRDDEGQSWEKVAVIVVSHPLLAAVINAGLDVVNGSWSLAVVSMGLFMKYGIPKWLDESGDVRDFWKRSRLIKLVDHPEKVKWKVSRFLEEFGYKVPDGHIPVFII